MRGDQPSVRLLLLWLLLLLVGWLVLPCYLIFSHYMFCIFWFILFGLSQTQVGIQDTIDSYWIHIQEGRIFCFRRTMMRTSACSRE
jgi:hypothetical protein